MNRRGEINKITDAKLRALKSVTS